MATTIGFKISNSLSSVDVDVKDELRLARAVAAGAAAEIEKASKLEGKALQRLLETAEDARIAFEGEARLCPRSSDPASSIARMAVEDARRAARALRGAWVESVVSAFRAGTTPAPDRPRAARSRGNTAVFFDVEAAKEAAARGLDAAAAAAAVACAEKAAKEGAAEAAVRRRAERLAGDAEAAADAASLALQPITRWRAARRADAAGADALERANREARTARGEALGLVETIRQAAEGLNQAAAVIAASAMFAAKESAVDGADIQEGLSAAADSARKKK